jgi:hypothetical protein
LGEEYKFLLDYVNILHLQRSEERKCRRIMGNDAQGK